MYLAKLTSAERKAKRRSWENAYNASPERKAIRATQGRAYRDSPKGKTALKAYRASKEYKAISAAWKSSPEGKAWSVAYFTSPERRVAQAAWRASTEGKAAEARRRALPERKATEAAYKASIKCKAWWAAYRISPRCKAIQAKARVLRTLRLSECSEHFTGDQYAALEEKANGVCVGCNQKRKLTADHVYPMMGDDIRFVSNAIENIQLICKSCNSSKSDRDPLLFVSTCKASHVARQAQEDVFAWCLW